MTLATLGVGYVAIGAVAALVGAIAGRTRTGGDALMMLGLWPLWLPLSLGGARTDVDHREQELLGALARAQSSPLASVLPDAESARVLAARLREAACGSSRLDAVLARPDSIRRRGQRAASSGRAARRRRRPRSCACARSASCASCGSATAASSRRSTS
ncbi:MAG: hypothetical protein KIT31_30790 [Deltaproteobacteria bacterium]|nr:hypothetical protein [Deltaproteobacteria bacterium]